MFEWIERLERMGPRGAPLALAIGAALLVGAGALALGSFGEIGAWRALSMRGGAFFFTILAMFFGMLGARMRVDSRYPDPAEVFPSLPKDEFRAAMYAAERPLAACSNCRIHLPAAFSTGSCPRCSSSLGWHTITNDEDADLVCSALVD